MRSSQGEWDQDLAPPQVPLGIIAVSVLRLKSTLKKKKKKIYSPHCTHKALHGLVSVVLSVFIHSQAHFC